VPARLSSFEDVAANNRDGADSHFATALWALRILRFSGHLIAIVGVSLRGLSIERSPGGSFLGQRVRVLVNVTGAALGAVVGSSLPRRIGLGATIKGAMDAFLTGWCADSKAGIDDNQFGRC